MDIYGNIYENFYNLRTTNSYRCRAITLVSCISHNICPPHNQHNGPTSLGTPHRQDSPSFAFRIIFSYIHHQPQNKIQIKCQRYTLHTWIQKSNMSFQNLLFDLDSSFWCCCQVMLYDGWKCFPTVGGKYWQTIWGVGRQF